MHNRLLILLFCFVSFLALGQAPKQTKTEVLFTVNKTPVSSDEFVYLYKKNHQNKPEDFTEVKINEYLNLFINFKLKVAEARTLGMDTTAKFSKEFKTYREDLKKPYRAEPDALERLTKEAYEHLTQEVRASHILINLKPDAFPSDTLNAYAKIDIIKKRIEAGEDFEKLARERGVAVGVASGLPIVIEKVGQFARRLEARGVLLAPVSATARAPERPSARTER
jgi:peptidyl-prolyl cis-trans isomerase SurA